MAPRSKIRIGEAAAAIVATPKALRHWISRYAAKGVKPSAEQTGTWLEFSFGDVAALAITKYLVDLGMPAFGAFSVAMKIVEQRWPGLFDVNAPTWFPTVENSHMFFFLTREGNWGFGSFAKWEATSVPPDSRAHIIVPVGAIVMDAFNALKDMGHERPACDASEIKQGLALSERQRIVLQRINQIQSVDGAMDDIEAQIAATTDPDEMQWMLDQLQALSRTGVKASRKK